MHYYTHHIKDFNNATRHLTRIERALYRELIELYYDIEQPLPTDNISWVYKKILALDDAEIAATNDILSEFFEIKDDKYTHSRCDEEIARYRANNSAKARAGKASAAARRKKKAPAKPRKTEPIEQNSTGVEHVLNTRTTYEQQTINQEPITKRKEKVEKETPPAAPSGGGVVDFNRRLGQSVFSMTADWQPSESFGDRAELCGLPESALNQPAFGEFKSYWSTRPEVTNSSDTWEHKLIGSLKRSALQNDLIEEQRKNANTPRTDKVTHDQSILDAIVGGPGVW